MQGPQHFNWRTVLRGVVDQHPELFAPVDASLNEVYLWHGTHVRAALNIAHEGFDIQTAGLNGTMYGKGLYFAENSSSESQVYELRVVDCSW